MIQAGYPAPPAYAPGPSYSAAAPSYSPPAPAYSAPAAAPAPAYTPPAPVCVKDPTIWIVFQPTATANDITAFLKGYNVTMENGPDASAMYRLRVNQVPQEQLGQLMDSMRTQTNVVSQVGA